MGGAKATLQARDVWRSFGEGETLIQVIRGVSLELCAGEVVLLMGPSGSGKSTLLALLSGLLRPDQGEVVALGQDLGRISETEQLQFRLRYCGFIFQGFNLFPALTAREQLEMYLEWSEGIDHPEAQRRVGQMLERMGLARRADVRADRLSGGEKQRVAIGRALLKAPIFCFADEPTSSLDWAHGEQVLHLLRSAAHERGATTLVVGHDERIIPFADRIIRLVDGQLSTPPATPTDGVAAP